MHLLLEDFGGNHATFWTTDGFCIFSAEIHLLSQYIARSFILLDHPIIVIVASLRMYCLHQIDVAMET